MGCSCQNFSGYSDWYDDFSLSEYTDVSLDSYQPEYTPEIVEDFSYETPDYQSTVLLTSGDSLSDYSVSSSPAYYDSLLGVTESFDYAAYQQQQAVSGGGPQVSSFLTGLSSLLGIAEKGIATYTAITRDTPTVVRTTTGVPMTGTATPSGGYSPYTLSIPGSGQTQSAAFPAPIYLTKTTTTKTVMDEKTKIALGVGAVAVLLFLVMRKLK